MGFLKNLKATKEAMAAGFRGEGPSEEALASLTPEQRAKYDEQMAKAAAGHAQALETQAGMQTDQISRIAQRPLHGPAGEWVHGSTALVGLSPEQAATMTSAEMMAWSTQQSKDQFKDLLKNPFGAKKPPPPMAPVDGDVDRGAQIAVERSARDAARQPYLAEHRMPLVFARLATRGKTQIEEVAAYLASSGLAGRPDLVYGLYRVPDRISPGLGGSEKGRVVEWDIVHAAASTLAPASTPTAVFFDGEEQWVRRSVGEPSIFDEDLGIAYLEASGVGPERTLGIARQLVIRNYSQGEDGQSEMLSHVAGMHVFHASDAGDPTSAGTGMLDQMRRDRPLDLPAGGPLGIHVEALNWGAVARAVHPARHRAYTIPSPFPYLPSTAQELIRMYIEVVGVRPDDCYATSVTEDGPRNIDGQDYYASGLIEVSTNVGESLPCADGKDRKRLAGGHVVILSYRDRPEYAVGRERWSAYQGEVLQATLENGVHVRPLVEAPHLDKVPGGLRQLIKVVEKIDDIVSSGDPLGDLAPRRYCWPPIKR